LPCGKRKFDEWGKEGKIMVGIFKKLANKIGLLRVWRFSEMAGKIFLFREIRNETSFAGNPNNNCTGIIVTKKVSLPPPPPPFRIVSKTPNSKVEFLMQQFNIIPIV
jgi:hypothetical protein